MTGAHELPGDTGGQERTLVERYERARRDAQELWMAMRGTRDAERSVSAAARREGQLIPLWARTAMTDAEKRAHEQYRWAVDQETAALADLSAYMDRKIAALSAQAADLAAGMVTQ